ncbi:MAG: F0F1 ATP synthase subunit B [Thermomicrobiales bacterium]
MDALGISGANFVVQLVAFILFVWIFWKFALGPITGMLDSRQATIRESLEEAERVRRDMAAAEARNEEILLEARREAQQILANAREQSDQNVARSREQAQQQAEDIVAQAQQVIQAEVTQARLELRQEIADLAVEAASRIVRANLDREAQSRLVEETLSEAGRNGSSSLN